MGKPARVDGNGVEVAREGGVGGLESVVVVQAVQCVCGVPCAP